MNQATCHSPLDWDSLLAYWLGELDPEREAGIEEHYLGCNACSQRLELLAAMARELRALAGNSGVDLVVSDAFVRRLSKKGLRVREYRVPPNGSVNCTVMPGDDFVVAHLEARLDGVQRVDMVYLDRDGADQIRHEDIPFIPRSGAVVLSTCVDTLRAMPETTLRLRLLAVGNDGERNLGEYRFHHRPYRTPPG